MPIIGRAAILLVFGLLTSPADAQVALRQTDQTIVNQIIQRSRDAYYATGHPCACPYDHARNGSMCGGRSAYSRPGGASPKCFPQDVTADDLAAYRARNQ